MLWCPCNLTMHQYLPALRPFPGVANSITRVRPLITIPSELGQPDIVLRVYFSKLAPRQRNLAVIAELVGIDRQLVFRPVVCVYRVLVGVSELAAYIVFFDGRPAGTAGCAVHGRRIFYAMEAIGDKPGKVAVPANSCFPRMFHSSNLRGCLL